MKIGQKILSLSMAVLLIFSLSTIASAATVTETYYYTVTQTATYKDTTIVSDVVVYHVKGTQDSIPYSISGTTHTYTFDETVFPATYRDGLLKAYLAEGFAKKVTSTTEDGSVIIVPAFPTGSYTVGLVYNYGSATWSVSKSSGSSITSGTFTDAPISYTVELVQIG